MLDRFAASVVARVNTYKRENGASAVEYGLLVAAIAALIVVVVFGLGRLVSKTFSDVSSSIQAGTN